MTNLLLGKLCCRLFIVQIHVLLRFANAIIDLLSVGLRIGFRQFFCFDIGLGVGKALGVENFLEVGQYGDEIMTRRIPGRIRRWDVQLTCLFMDVWIVDMACKYNFRPHVDIVVFGRQSEFKLEYSIRKWSSTHKNNAEENPQIVHGGNQVDAPRSMGF